MKQFLERASILALSLVLITSFSISSALPAMFDYYQGYPKEQIELLASLPSFGIMIMFLYFLLIFYSFDTYQTSKKRRSLFGV